VELKVNGQWQVQSASAYDPTQPGYLRFRATGNVVALETSSNNVNFVTVGQGTMAQSPVVAELAVETGGPVNAGQAQFDDFQVANTTLQFSTPSFTAGEGDGQTTIMVTRSGDTSGTATVNYASTDGTAVHPGQYVATSGSLTFGPGVTTRSFPLELVENALVTGDVTVNLNLSNASGAGLSSPGRTVLTIRENDSSLAAPTVQFSQANYNVGEANGNVTVTVTRSGDTSGTSTVSYTTSDTDNFTIPCFDTTGTSAFGRCDFATSLDTLTFAAGETSKTFQVPIIDDALDENNETFTMTLSSASGATLGASSGATVTIVDNDTGAGLNPIFQTPFFVRQHYLDFLSREPDQTGFNAWVNVLTNCPSPLTPTDCDQIAVSSSFFGSVEFQLKGYFAYRFYKLAFNRLPTYAEIVNDMRAVTGATSAEVYQKKAAFTNAFVLRTEFANTYNGLSNAQYVATLMNRYSLQQIVTPDPADPDGANKVMLTTAELTNRLGAGTMTRAQVLRAIADSDEVFQLEYNRAFVAMQYYGYLRRTPELAGYNDNLNFLNSPLRPGETSNKRFREMVSAFMNSTEYRLRFGSNTNPPSGVQR
jgi:hypothetical protein